MFSNYFTIAIRHFNRQKGYSLINVMSLALGIACCLLILLYIRDELSYDRFYDRADRTYRVTAEYRQGGEVVRNADVLIPTVWYMREDLPEIEDMVRLVPPGNAWMVKYGDKGFYERNFYLADTTVFNVFDVPLLTGNPKTALTGNDKIVLSESMARKYFGDEDPMGRILDAEGTFHLEVTGIMPDLPSNTHLGFDILASFKIQEAYSNTKVDEWGWRTAHSYIVLREGSDPAELGNQAARFRGKTPRESLRRRRRISDVQAAAGDGYPSPLPPGTGTDAQQRRQVCLSLCRHCGFHHRHSLHQLHEPGDRPIRGPGQGNRSSKGIRRGPRPDGPAVPDRIAAHERTGRVPRPAPGGGQSTVVQPAHRQIAGRGSGHHVVRPRRGGGHRRRDRLRFREAIPRSTCRDSRRSRP